MQHTYQRNVFKSVVRKPERKRPVGRSMFRWEDNIKTVIKNIDGRSVV
jgi:hypothetical protein